VNDKEVGKVADKLQGTGISSASSSAAAASSGLFFIFFYCY